MLPGASVLLLPSLPSSGLQEGRLASRLAAAPAVGVLAVSGWCQAHVAAVSRLSGGWVVAAVWLAGVSVA